MPRFSRRDGRKIVDTVRRSERLPRITAYRPPPSRFYPVEGGTLSNIPIPITVSLPLQEMDDDGTMNLASFTLPDGKEIVITHAYVADHVGAPDAGFFIKCFNVTDAESVYVTSEATLQEGTVGAPLGSGAEGDKIYIRIENHSGDLAYMSGLMTFVVR